MGKFFRCKVIVKSEVSNVGIGCIVDHVEQVQPSIARSVLNFGVKLGQSLAMLLSVLVEAITERAFDHDAIHFAA